MRVQDHIRDVQAAGEAGQLVAREMLRSPELGQTPIGFVDDDPRKRGMRIHGLKVLGTTSELPRTSGSARLVTVVDAPGSLVLGAMHVPNRVSGRKYPFLDAVLDRAAGKVTPLTGQGSHQIATLGKANALVVVPEWVVQMSEGDTAEVLVLP